MEDRSHIVHIFDDDKFIDPVIKLFESVFPNQSHYLVISSKGKSYKYVKSKQVVPLYLSDKESFTNILERYNSKVVFFHALNLPKQEIVIQLPDHIVKVWFIWGFDLYGNWQLLNKHLYQSETKHFLSKTNNIKRTLKNKLLFNNFSFNILSALRRNQFSLPRPFQTLVTNNYFNKFYKAAEKIDIVVPVIPNEYQLVKKMKINPIYAPFTNGCIEDMLTNNLETNLLEGKNILVGNSGNPSNNHVDIFKKLSKIHLGNRNIIVPLSYAGTKEYVNFVIEKGTYFFGENFRPLIDFMPLEAYNKLVSSCGFIIFNHVRQQAVGNIIAMGFQGGKIFLNKKSPVYTYYKDEGIKVYSTDELNQKNLGTHLSDLEFKENQQKYFNLYSREAVQNKIRILFKVVNEKLLENKHHT